MKLSPVLIVLSLAGCSTVSPYSPRDLDPEMQGGAPPQAPRPPSQKPVWNKGQTLMQGFIGVSYYDKITREGGAGPDVEGADGGVNQMPLIGGGGQWKAGGEGLDYGIEGFFSLEGSANAAAFAVGGGGAAVAVDVDLLTIDIYGGPFVSKFLGDKLRVYAGAGPLLQFAEYDQEFANTHDHGSGFGVGWYARTGFEFILESRTLVGLGWMWSDSTVDLSGGLGDLEIEGSQVYLTVTRGF